MHGTVELSKELEAATKRQLGSKNVYPFFVIDLIILLWLHAAIHVFWKLESD